MKKINNKGFMLAEIIIVSAIIMVTIVGVYKGFSNTHKIYAIRNSYYDSNVLYSLKTFENFLVDSMALNKVSSGAYEIKRDGSTPAGLFGNDQYTKKSLENFFDTYAISKLYLVKYDKDKVIDYVKAAQNMENDIVDFVTFYLKNLPDGEQYDKYDYIIIARTGVAAGNDSRQVAEKYGALRIGSGTSTAPTPTPTNPTTPTTPPTQPTPVTDPCTKNDPITFSYSGSYELLHNNKIMKIKTAGRLNINTDYKCDSKKITALLISGGNAGSVGSTTTNEGGTGGNGANIKTSPLKIMKGTYTFQVGQGEIAKKYEKTPAGASTIKGGNKIDPIKITSNTAGSNNSYTEGWALGGHGVYTICKNHQCQKDGESHKNMTLGGYDLGYLAGAGGGGGSCASSQTPGNGGAGGAGNGGSKNHPDGYDAKDNTGSGGGGGLGCESGSPGFGGNGGSGVIFLYFEDGFQIS